MYGIKLPRWWNLDNFLLAICSMALVAVYGLYIIDVDKLIHSDMAAEMLNGKEMFLQKSLFVSNWYHSTEIFLIRSQLLIALWSIFFDDLLVAHRFTVVTEILLEILCLIYMLSKFQIGKKACWLAILVFFGIGAYGFGTLLGMGWAPYATLYMFGFLTLGYYAARQARIFGYSEKILRLLLPIMALLFGISSIRSLLILFIPLFIVHFGRMLWAKKPDKAWTQDILKHEVLLWVTLSIIGLLIRKLFIAPLGFGPVAFENYTTVGLDSILKNLPGLFSGLVHFTGLNVFISSFPFFSWRNVGGLSLLFTFGFVVYMIPSVFKSASAGRAIGLYTTGLSVLLTSFMMIYTLPNFATPNIRYLLYILIFISLAVACTYERLAIFNQLLPRIFLAGIFVAVMMNSVANYQMLVSRRNDFKNSMFGQVDKIEAIFKKYGIKNGYALFWDSYPITVLTQGRISVSAVKDDLKPFTWATASSNYAASRHSEKMAFILKEGVREKQHQDLLKRAVAVERIDGFKPPVDIYIFDHNFVTIPQNLKKTDSVTYLPLSHMGWSGFLSADGYNVVTDVNETRKIVFGPNVDVPKGCYIATLSYEVEDAEGKIRDIGIFRIYDNSRKKIFSKTPIKSDASTLTVGPVFIDDDYPKVEFVTMIHGNYKGAVKVKSIKVTRVKECKVSN